MSAALALASVGGSHVLVIPGLDGQTGLWRSVASTVLPGLRPVWFDHANDRAEGGFEGLADRALARLDAAAESSEPAYVLGESFGGPVALTLARRYPDRVRGLILVSTFGWYHTRFLARSALMAWQLLGDRASQQLLRWSHPLTALGALGINAPREVVRAYLRRPLGDIRAYRAKCELILQFDARAWLAEILHRSFVLIGSSDRVVPPSSGRLLAEQLPAGYLYTIAGGHMPWCVYPERVGAMLGEWLQFNERR